MANFTRVHHTTPMTRPLLALALWLLATTLSAQVVINEISAANMNGLPDGDGDREDWIELYNKGAASANLSGWFLSDNPGNPQKWVIPNGQTIAAGGYRTIFCSGKDKIAGAAMHTNFKLTQTKNESVVLTQVNGTTADSYTFSTPNQGDHSYGRTPNGGAGWAIYTTPTPGAANTATAYQAYASGVLASQEAGFYPGSVMVSLTTGAGSKVRYTVNGSEPTATSPLYSAPLNFSATTVLKARAFSSNAQILPGFVLANTYFINVNHTVPVISIAGDNVMALLNGSQSNPSGSFEYFENNLLQTEAYGEFNKHGNDSWAYSQRGIDWITRDQLGYKDLLKYKFFKERTRTKFQRLILKAAANDNYPAADGAHIRDSYVHTLAIQGGLDVDARTHRSCVLYVNGQYWGVYDLREKVDDADFTSYYYDQDEPDIDYIKTWGTTWQEYGSWTDWYTLKNFILSNNMANAANYDYVLQQFDVLSLIDYIIINQHSVCKDWLVWNTSWWRGRNPAGEAKRWRYALWDMDATFGHYINYTGIPNIGPNADPCDVEQISDNNDPQNHIDVFVALSNNPQFKAMYINRYADLLNTSLSCQNMIALLDSMTNTIAPEMAKQCARWGGTVSGWNQNVNEIRNFINSRCQVLDQGIVDCYQVTGPFGLTVKISPAASPNQVMVNTILPTTYPFVGDYFGWVNIDLIAKPAPGWQFDHWEVTGNTFGPNQQAAAILLAFQTNGMATAFFIPTGPCTEPTGIAFSDLPVADALDWVDQLSASSYLIKYRKMGNPVWTEFSIAQNTWNVDTLPGCSNYELQIQSVCPQGNSAFVDYAFSTPDQLLGFALADTVVCNSLSAVLDATVSGATYQWDNGSSAPTRSVNNSGKYWVTVKLNGCTLTDTASVSLVNASANIQPVLCPGESFLLGNQTFDAQHPSGQVNLGNIATGACDSIVNVSLTFLAPSQNHLYKESCNPASVGVDTIVLSSVAGCDSLVITTTSLVPFSQTFLTATSCNPNLVGTDTLMLANYFGCDSLVITTTTFDAAAISITPLFVQNCNSAAVGVDTVFLTTILGCDSLVITTTSLAPMSQTFLTATSCNPNLVGTDTLILTNYFGCDSLVITTTAFDAAAISITPLFVKNCNLAAVGVDTVFLTSVAGCDSLVVTTTSLAPMSQTFLTATSCNPNLVGTDTLILTNYFGCDSLVITATAFDAAAISITPLFIKNCNPAVVGVDTIFLTSVAGCDSLVVTTISLAPMSQTFLTATSCNPNLMGTDTLILANQFGCDSLVITTTAFDAAAISITPLFMQNCNLAVVGVDTVFLTSVAGCDSLVITTTSLAPMSQTFLTATSCNPTLVGTDTLILANQFGCDSLVITTTAFDAAAISITSLFVKNCNPAAVGMDTVFLSSVAGCDSLVITTTSLAPMSQTFLTATSCNPNLVGMDTLILANQFGCDSLVITAVDFIGLDLAASTRSVLCFDGNDGVIQLDSVLTYWLPVELSLENQPVQIYTGTPLIWEDLAAGTYSLLATNSEGCTITKVVDVADANALYLDLGQQPDLLHLGDSIWVEPVVNFQVATAEWLPQDGVRCPSCPATFIAAQQTHTYTLTVFDINGCSTSASFTLQVDQGVRVYVPNAIHLGSSGPNANLTIFAGPEVERIQSLQVFDRWGNQVFEQKDLAPNTPSTWDGTFHGKLISPGVLLWICQVETIDGRIVKMRGDITVLR